MLLRACLFCPEKNALAAVAQETLLRLNRVSRYFAMGEVTVRALDGVSLQIARGELLVVVGPSGSGKTTLLNLLGGMDLPTAGDIYFGSRRLNDFTPRELTQYRRHHVGYVFQFYNLIPNLTALENVLVATQISRNPIPAREALALVGLEDRCNHFPAQLSGGEQQRVAIARAVAKQPELLLCDEPTGALDFDTAHQVLALLERINRQLGTTVVIITHNLAIGQMARRVVRLRSGQVAAVEENPQPVPPEEIEW